MITNKYIKYCQRQTIHSHDKISTTNKHITSVENSAVKVKRIYCYEKRIEGYKFIFESKGYN